MTPQQRYSFDVDGMLVVPNALTVEQVGEVNALLDAREAALTAGTLAEVGGSTNRVGDDPLRDNPLHWAPVMRAMLDNPRISPLLEELIGAHGDGWSDISEQMPSFRIDHVNVNHMPSSPGAQLHNSGDGSSHSGGSQFFRFQDGRFYNGLLVVAYELRDTTPNGGGFGWWALLMPCPMSMQLPSCTPGEPLWAQCVRVSLSVSACCSVPGSHKANISMPEEFRDLSGGGSGPPNLRRVPARAGDAIVFTEVGRA